MNIKLKYAVMLSGLGMALPSSASVHTQDPAHILWTPRFVDCTSDNLFAVTVEHQRLTGFQVGHLALSRSPMAASRASVTILAWSKVVNLPARRMMRPSTITVSTLVGRPNETIAS